MFVSGGSDGCVIIWQLNVLDSGGAHYNLEKFYEYNVTSDFILIGNSTNVVSS